MRSSPQNMIPLGSKLGPYEVLSLLGAGGMGEVYRARDPRLNRDVAIKVLHANRMADENRRRRFVQEARSASALNHPNIVTIYEIDAVDGIDFIVMEYVPGKSLDALIQRQGMRLGEILRTAIAMADALARAHARGIVHRDFKPANVMVSTEGVVKVLDFGLAKLVSEEDPSDDHDPASRDTAESPLTHAGAIAGTAGYMSPEQATAGRVDSRSDVFAFGSVLYEMVTGRRAFAGNSTAETLAAVVREQPKPPSSLVPSVPKDLEKLIQRCLRKEPDRRFQAMLDVKVELNEIKEESESGPVAAVTPARRGRRGWWVVGGVTVMLALAAAFWLLPRTPKAELPPPRLVSVTSMRGSEWSPAFSPDGNQVAFAWRGEKGDNWDIYLKMIGSSEMRRLTTDPADDVRPRWSPDGRQIAFVHRVSLDTPDEIHVVSPIGGADRKLSDFPMGGRFSWSPDGRWLAAARYRSRAAQEGDPQTGGIYLVPVLGGEPRSLTSAKSPAYHLDPVFAMDGSHLAYASCFADLACDVEVVALDLDYKPKGSARHLTRRVGRIEGLAWSRDGASVVYGDVTTGRLWRAWIEGDRPPEKIELAGLGAIEPATVASVDRLAFAQGRVNNDIYRYQPGHAPDALLVSSFNDCDPQLSPNGRRIAFESGRAGDGQEVWLADVDGANATQLTRGPGVWQGSPRWSPDGRRIAFDSQGEDGHWDIWTIDVDGGSPTHITHDPGDENMPSWSRDGRFIYIQSDHAGAKPDVWRVPAAGGTAERLTHSGGHLPYESADGKTLFFLRADSDSPLLALPLAGGPERKLLECVPEKGYAVGPGGLYHLACEADASGTPLHLLDPVTGGDRLLGRLENGLGGLTVTPDGKTILYTRQVGEGSDLMMIENFR